MQLGSARPRAGLLWPNVTTSVGVTLVTLYGSGLGGGARYLCRFGEIGVPAWYDAQRSEVFCHAPADALVNASRTVPVDLSLNGVDFPVTGLSFTYLPPPDILSVTPRSGPVDGGTSVTLQGVFSSGTAWVRASPTGCRPTALAHASVAPMRRPNACPLERVPAASAAP